MRQWERVGGKEAEMKMQRKMKRCNQCDLMSTWNLLPRVQGMAPGNAHSVYQFVMLYVKCGREH